MTNPLKPCLPLLAMLLLGLLPLGAARAQTSSCEAVGTVGTSQSKFIYQNNHYSPSSGSKQCITVLNADTGGFSITSTNDKTTHGAPASYPSVFIGCHWGNCSNNAISNLPAQVSDLASADTTWSVSPVTSGSWDIAYDIWFNRQPTTSGQPDGTEIMIWLDHTGDVQPAGKKFGSKVYNGINYDIWIAPRACCGFNTTWNVVSFVARKPQRSVNFSLLPFFNDMVTAGFVDKSWWLIDVEAGFEPWKGGSGLTSNAFSFHLTKYSQGAR